MKLKEPITLQSLDIPTTTWLVLMHLGCFLAPFYFTWGAFWTFVGLYILTGLFGVTIGFHRLLTHRSFKTPKWFEYAITMICTLTAQRSPVYWVAKHRMHHAFSDTDKDPHSPRHGFWWSHMLWVVTDKRVPDENEYYKKYAPDLASDPGHRWIQKTHNIWPLLLGAGLLIFGGLPYLVWGLFVRTTVVYHLTWVVNSAGHVWGYQNYDTGEDSKNNFLLSLLTFGEGWHNNHHAYQTLAHHGCHKWWEVDITYLTIRLLGFLGLAWDIRQKNNFPR